MFNNVGYCFSNRRRYMLKCLYVEDDGLANWHKKLPKGTFPSLCSDLTLLSFSDLLLSFMRATENFPNTLPKRHNRRQTNLYPNDYPKYYRFLNIHKPPRVDLDQRYTSTRITLLQYYIYTL